MQRQPDLLNSALATVVPEPPFPAIENRVRFVYGVVVPFVVAGTNDRIGWMALPAGDPVPGSGDTDLGFIHVEETDVEHDVPVALTNDLATCDPLLLPQVRRLRLEDGIALVLGPL